MVKIPPKIAFVAFTGGSFPGAGARLGRWGLTPKGGLTPAYSPRHTRGTWGMGVYVSYTLGFSRCPEVEHCSNTGLDLH